MYDTSEDSHSGFSADYTGSDRVNARAGPAAHCTTVISIAMGISLCLWSKRTERPNSNPLARPCHMCTQVDAHRTHDPRRQSVRISYLCVQLQLLHVRSSSSIYSSRTLIGAIGHNGNGGWSRRAIVESKPFKAYDAPTCTHGHLPVAARCPTPGPRPSANAPMRPWANAPMRRCADAPMRQSACRRIRGCRAPSRKCGSCAVGCASHCAEA